MAEDGKVVQKQEDASGDVIIQLTPEKREYLAKLAANTFSELMEEPKNSDPKVRYAIARDILVTEGIITGGKPEKPGKSGQSLPSVTVNLTAKDIADALAGFRTLVGGGERDVTPKDAKS